MKQKGYTLIEILVVIGIVAVIGTVVMVSLIATRDNARDTKRKSDLSQIGKIISMSCFMPSGGEGSYDLVDVMGEIFIANPQYKKYISKIPTDPRSGSEVESYYLYLVSADGNNCAVIANLENNDATVELSITEPTPGGGTGVFEGSVVGVNGTNKFYQVSK